MSVASIVERPITALRPYARNARFVQSGSRALLDGQGVRSAAGAGVRGAFVGGLVGRLGGRLSANAPGRIGAAIRSTSIGRAATIEQIWPV